MKFSELDLHPKLQVALEKMQFTECTPIQALAIPKLLEGYDLAGLAQTGTGKTAAFLLPLMDRILRGMDEGEATESSASTTPAIEAADEITSEVSEDDSSTAADLNSWIEDKPRTRQFDQFKKRHFVLVLVPTRELAEQVLEMAEKLKGEANLSATAIYGGMPYEKQKLALERGAQIVIATPGRLIDLYKEHLVDLKLVRAIVFDEADRMFDMGFKDDMKFILRRIPVDRQFLVFSATLNFDVLTVAYQFGARPLEVSVSRDQAKAEHVKDTILHVGPDEKPRYLLSLIRRDQPKQTIIFSNFKHNVDRLVRFLQKNDCAAVGISSLLSQAQRNRVMDGFKGSSGTNILVATDLAARGLDVSGVDLVINFELPDDAENYVHRIGRTGRAGKEGRAYSLVADRDLDSLNRIHDYLKNKLEVDWIEDSDLVTDFVPMPRSENPAFRAPQASGEKQEGARRPRRPERGGRRDGARGNGRTEERARGPRDNKVSKPSKSGGSKPIGAPKPVGSPRPKTHHTSSPQNSGPRPLGKPNLKPLGKPIPNPTKQSKDFKPVSRPSNSNSSGGLGSKVVGFFKRLFSP